MEPSSQRGLGERVLLIAACLVVVIAGLRAAAPLLVPFTVALFLAVLSLPLLSWFQRHRVPGVAAVLLTVLVNILIVVLLVLTVSGSVQGFAEAVPRYRTMLNTMATDLTVVLHDRGIEGAMLVPEEWLKPGEVLDLAATTLLGLAKVLSNTALVLLTIVFVLLEVSAFPGKVARAFGVNEGELARFAQITGQVQRYLGFKTLISIVTGLLAWILTAAAGVDFPLLWGLVAWLLNYVPNIGSIIAALPPTLLALIQHGPGRALVVVVGYVIINMTLGNVVEPHLMGRKLGLSTLVVFVSLVFWGWLWGPVGMLLSVPLTMVVKIMLENTQDLRWVAVLLDGGQPAPVVAAGPSRIAPPSSQENA